MLLLTVFLPLFNFFLFATTSLYVNRRQLAVYVFTSMGTLLFLLLLAAPGIIAGETQTASLGV